MVLRSQHPAGVEQEIFGFLLVHHALRDLMHKAAQQAEHDPDHISFTRTLRIVRRQVTDQAAFSPSRPTRALATALREIRERPLPPRQLRNNPRVIKRKMSNGKLKRSEHRNPSRPDAPRAALVGPTKPRPTRGKTT
ncbi:hypothetical protein STRIP9103_02596 [Streptomyces ipomoeae 91-03]|nr:hypothetical protein STRIP9103_02596 [Streptomyces ipomoeae 91-03]